ncbi:MarR family transcriptional regulator [Actinomadura sp. 6K520]|uniref:MarR family winged helix-turn-helix transcriptional regulator n=1 Tax=Actinomadura sp. 6K520 TaxID=2530364 RepID=UPI001A9FF1FD|nr:MarR family transcriptional regulator [Actinomadura sp. 6K520]
MSDRTELGFLLDRLLREVTRREQPIFERHGLQMWDYVVLAVLGRGPARTQAGLAAATGRDKTRLIRNLDLLERSGLIRRTPDPADRRNHTVSLTPEGERTLLACREEIRAMEDELLAPVGTDQRAAFERTLRTLVTRAAPPPEQR